MSLVGACLSVCLSVCLSRLCVWDLCDPVIITSFYHVMNFYFCSAHVLLSEGPLRLCLHCFLQLLDSTALFRTGPSSPWSHLSAEL
jgi:hypothetical protein